MVKEKTRVTKKEKKTDDDGSGVRKNWFADNRTTIWQLFLVLFGVVLGVVGSTLWVGFQNHQIDESVARGLYNELNASDNPVKIWAPAFIDGSPTEPLIDTSFFVNTSVFPSIIDNDQRFDEKLKMNITNYYTNLSSAEDYRLKLEKIQKIDQNATNSSYAQYNVSLEKEYSDAMKSKLLYCYKQMPIIKTQIEKYFRI